MRSEQFSEISFEKKISEKGSEDLIAFNAGNIFANNIRSLMILVRLDE